MQLTEQFHVPGEYHEACDHLTTLVQTHDTDDGHCMQCGDAVSPGCYIEVEFPLGAAALPGRLAGQLCGDCAASVACNINHKAFISTGCGVAYASARSPPTARGREWCGRRLGGGIDVGNGGNTNGQH